MRKDEIIRDWLGGLALAVILAAGTTCAKAQEAPLTPQMSGQSLMNALEVSSDICGAGATVPQSQKDRNCRRADLAAHMLESRGYVYSSHRVWYSAANAKLVEGLAYIIQLDDGPRTPQQTYVAAINALAGYGITQVEFIAIWNALHERIRDEAPHGWAVLSGIAQEIALENPRDVRFAIDGE